MLAASGQFEIIHSFYFKLCHGYSLQNYLQCKKVVYRKKFPFSHVKTRSFHFDFDYVEFFIFFVFLLSK